MIFRELSRRKSKWISRVASLFVSGMFLAASSSAIADDSPADLGAGNNPLASIEAVMTEDGYLYHAFQSASSITYAGDGSEQWRFNPTGEDITVDRNGTGDYTVTVSASDHFFMPNVTALSTGGSTNCKVHYFYYPGNFVNIYCFNSSTGALADSKFSLRWTSTVEDAYAWVSESGVPCCENNPWGASVSASQVSTGVYSVTTPGGPNFEGGHIQVTAYGSGSDHCKVNNWGSTTATVRCYDSTGTATDSAFTFLRVGSNDDAYIWANNASATTAYVGSIAYSHNPQIAAPTSVKTGAGSYTVQIPDLAVEYGGNVQVTAYGSSEHQCVTSGWGGETVNVRCTDSTGVLADSRFNMLYTRFQTCDGKPANIEIGNNVPTTQDDIIVGTPAADSISGLGGNDIICGMGGADALYGGPGNDTIYGGDTVGFDDTYNNLYGGSGNDTLYGATYDDHLYGQGGSDRLETSNTLSGFGDIMSGGSGNDVLISNSNAGTNMRGNGNNDSLYGSSVADVMKGDPGLDTIYGNGGADTIEGGNGADYIHGGGGPDTIYGQGSPDTLHGGAGDDTIYGGNQNDSIDGGSGSDYCNGQGQTGGAGDTESNCEITAGFPIASLVDHPIQYRPGRLPLNDVEIQAIDKCNQTLEDCLGK